MITKLLPAYDPTLFQGAIPYYVDYRPRYPEAVYRLIQESFHLDGRGRLLDLGCGIGLVALTLEAQFEEVIGIDPDPEMLRVAIQESEQQNAQKITWKQGLAEEITDDLGSFRLVTIGRAFHWMDKPTVLQRSYERLDSLHLTDSSKSGIAIIQTEKDIWSNDSEWAQNVLTVIKKWLGEKRRVGSTTVPLLYQSDLEILEASPYKQIEKHTIDFQKQWTVDTFIGYLYSTAYCRRDYISDIPAFEADIRAALLASEPSGVFVEDIPITVYLGFKA
ncbi:class I SAM-dependent methyltransferase [Synechococcus elongatus]|uniref:Methyltransferase domain-containing protein n=1 Tax=Synechococcus elongatus PCC 11801 TaxID=2219813 RepID=A0AAN1QPS6_SYNEL|nr:methyltransferase domain-containing protein [Synechococcus elongatus]AZB73279.1 class I SAM-dependent methyltransferase [Synechococcus elongatus PCC 11801]